LQLIAHVSLSAAFFTAEQVPTVPLKLQAMQDPVQELLQQ